MARKKYTVLTKPLSKAAIRRAVKAHERVEGVIAIELDDIVGLDLEGLLDRLGEELVGSCLLMDQGYAVVGHDEDTLHLLVSGDASDVVNNW